MPVSLRVLNAMDRAAFVAAVGGTFEHSPWIAERTWDARPFASRDALHAALCATVATATTEEQEGLIRAHPDLVGRAARAGTLTPASTNEQAGAGLDALSADEVALFDQYNAAYRERFGFPFVICARTNKKASILAAFPVRLQHTREAEVATALAEIAEIARFRLADTVADDTTDTGAPS
ncbi:MAG TPA: 2-oxo-4-hydroxy-4-carboxy-5-ureidoimidazoline decarboxylase [Rhodothermales bacterium]|nr:2-oxo-4-hydroxy-4-carboxy-5-ureidoimidazoline decarboxylase [Rhodothermales bacterium]